MAVFLALAGSGLTSRALVISSSEHQDNASLIGRTLTINDKFLSIKHNLDPCLAKTKKLQKFNVQDLILASIHYRMSKSDNGYLRNSGFQVYKVTNLLIRSPHLHAL